MIITRDEETGDRQAWSFSEDGKTVGALAAIPVRLKAANTMLKAAWAVDFNTQQAYRRRGIGSRLVEEANKSFDVFLAIGASDSSFALFKKNGWVYCGELPHYIRIFDFRGLIGGRVKNPLLAGILSLAASAFTKIPGIVYYRRITRDIKVTVIEHFDVEADLLWEKVKDSYGFAVVRDSAFLINRYGGAGGKKYIRLRAAKDGELAGYAVLRVIDKSAGKPEGLITDIIAAAEDKDKIAALLLNSAQYLASQGCVLVRCYSSSPVIRKVLLSAGFLRRKSWMRFMIKNNTGVSDEIYNLDNWYLSAADSDIDRG